MTADPWTCRWCGARYAVPSLTVQHEATCPLKPKDEK